MPRMVMALGLALVVASTVGLQAEIIVKEAEQFPTRVRRQGRYPQIEEDGKASGGKTVVWDYRVEAGKEGYIEWDTGALNHRPWVLWVRGRCTQPGATTGIRVVVKDKPIGELRAAAGGDVRAFFWRKFELGAFSGGALRLLRGPHRGYAVVDLALLTDDPQYDPPQHAGARSEPRAASQHPRQREPRLIRNAGLTTGVKSEESRPLADPFLYGAPYVYSPWLAALPENSGSNFYSFAMTGGYRLAIPVSDGVSVRCLANHYYGITASETPSSYMRLDYQAEGGHRTSHSTNLRMHKRSGVAHTHAQMTNDVDAHVRQWLDFSWRSEMAVTGLLDLMNEPRAHVAHHVEDTQLFRDWLTKKYGSLAALNADWQTRYGGLHEIIQPDANGPIALADRARWLNWMQFRCWTLDHIHQVGRDAVRAYGAMGLPRYTTEILMHQGAPKKGSYLGGAGYAWWGVDMEALAALQDVNGVHIYNRRVSDALFTTSWLLGLGDEKPLYDLETGYNADYVPVWAQLARGVRFVQIFQAYDYPGAQGFGKFNDRHFTEDKKLVGRPRDQAFLYADMAFEIRRWAALLNTSASAPAEVALLYPWTTLLQNPDDPAPFGELYGYYQAFLEAGFSTRIVTEKQIKAGCLSTYKLLVLPAAVNLEPEVCAAIRTWVERGGRLFASARSSRYDHYYRGRGQQFLLGDVLGCEETLFGACADNIVLRMRPSLPGSHWAKLNGQTLENRVANVRFYGEVRPRAGAVVVATNPNGSAAAVYNRWGRGAATYWCGNVGMMYHFSDSYGFTLDPSYSPSRNAERLRALIVGFALEAGVKPDMQLAAPDRRTRPVLMSRQLAAHADLIFLFPSDGSLPPDYRLRVPASRGVVSVSLVSLSDQGNRELQALPWARQGDLIECRLPGLSAAAMLVLARDYQPVVSLRVEDQSGAALTWRDTIEEGARLRLKLAIDNLSARSLAGRVYAESQLWPDRPGFNFVDLKPGERAEAAVDVIVGDIAPHDIRELTVADGVFRYVIEGRAFLSQPNTGLTLPATVGVSVKDIGAGTSPIAARRLTALQGGDPSANRTYDQQRAATNAVSYTFQYLDAETAAKYVKTLDADAPNRKRIPVAKWDAATRTVTFDKSYPEVIDQLRQADYRTTPAKGSEQ
ncbi:MAG: beta-galactosidase trimerization domain-containing protein [Kiritimatiellae bacterium]|nr:beta-galactosidase trimerization domain-containing protein [Kiritimatiellia bacterium]